MTELNALHKKKNVIHHLRDVSIWKYIIANLGHFGHLCGNKRNLQARFDTKTSCSFLNGMFHRE